MDSIHGSTRVVFRTSPHRNVGIFFSIISYIQKHLISLVYE